MKIQLLSDLHLEVHPQFVAQPAAGADVLVLAGDIGSYQSSTQVDGENFGLERFSPLPQYASWPTPVLFVPGNHEYDSQDFDEARIRLQRTCDKLGLIWLDRETVLMDGVRFIGTTLWSDFDAIAMHEGVTDVTRLHQLREKAYRAANFYLQKTGGTRQGQPFLAEPMRAESLLCQDWLRAALQQPYDAGPTVAVTHFAPSLRSADPRYGLVPGTAGFCNVMDDLLPFADLWLHGHLHCASDYLARGVRADGSAWQCRVVANPLGYARKGEQEQFQAASVIDLSQVKVQAVSSL